MRSSCSECGGAARSRTITQELEREGMRVSLSGIRALVCMECGAIYLEPGGAQALVEAVECLFSLARQNHQRKGKLTAKVS